MEHPISTALKLVLLGTLSSGNYLLQLQLLIYQTVIDILRAWELQISDNSNFLKNCISVVSQLV
jgi:hypothetical protein